VSPVPEPASPGARLGRLLDLLLTPSVLGRVLAGALVAQLGLALALGGGEVLLAGAGTVEIEGAERWVYADREAGVYALDLPRLVVGICLALAGAIGAVSLWPQELRGRSRKLRLSRLTVIAGPPVLALVPPLLASLPAFHPVSWLIVAMWMTVLWLGVPFRLRSDGP
jgi:hypothetical protein